MDIGAAHIALGAANEHTLDPVQSLIQGLCHPGRPVSRQHFAIDRIGVDTVVYQHHGFCAFSIKAKHIHSLIQGADGMVDVGVIDGRTSPGAAVLHLIPTDIGHPFRCIAYDITHPGRLHICKSQLGSFHHLGAQELSICQNRLRVCLKHGSRCQEGAGVGMGGGNDDISRRNACFLFHQCRIFCHRIFVDHTAVHAHQEDLGLPLGKSDGTNTDIV